MTEQNFNIWTFVVTFNFTKLLIRIISLQFLAGKSSFQILSFQILSKLNFKKVQKWKILTDFWIIYFYIFNMWLFIMMTPRSVNPETLFKMISFGTILTVVRASFRMPIDVSNIWFLVGIYFVTITARVWRQWRRIGHFGWIHFFCCNKKR